MNSLLTDGRQIMVNQRIPCREFLRSIRDLRIPEASIKQGLITFGSNRESMSGLINEHDMHGIYKQLGQAKGARGFQSICGTTNPSITVKDHLFDKLIDSSAKMKFVISGINRPCGV